MRSVRQAAAADGEASRADSSIGGCGLTGAGVGGASGYTRPPEGKVVAASLPDNFNKRVLAIRDLAPLIKPSSAAGGANAALSTRAESPQQAGQMLQAKIANVKACQDAAHDSVVVATVQRSDALVTTGEARNGFVRVDAASSSGWLQHSVVGAMPGAQAQPLAQAAPPSAPVPVSVSVSVSVPAVAYRCGNFAGSVDGADMAAFACRLMTAAASPGRAASTARACSACWASTTERRMRW